MPNEDIQPVRKIPVSAVIAAISLCGAMIGSMGSIWWNVAQASLKQDDSLRQLVEIKGWMASRDEMFNKVVGDSRESSYRTSTEVSRLDQRVEQLEQRVGIRLPTRK